MECPFYETSTGIQDLIYHAINDILQVDGFKAPQDKLASIVGCAKKIFFLIQAGNKIVASADDFLPSLIFILLKANPPRMQSNINFITRFSDEARLRSGEEGYYFTNLCCALNFIESVTAASLNLPQSEFDSFMSGEIPPGSWGATLIMCEGIQSVNTSLAALKELEEMQEKIMSDCEKLEKEMEEFQANIASEVQQVILRTNYTIRGSKKDGISTGFLTETQAYFGIFGDIRAGDALPAGNLNTTLEGQVNPALLTYQNRDGASRLFKETLTDLGPIISTFSGEVPLSITFSEPDNQEFDLATFLQTPGEVAFVNLGVVSDRPKYLELREKLFAKFANSPYVKDFYKFNIWREQPEELPFIDNSKVELFMYTAKSREDQAKWVQDLVTNDSEFVNEWWDTFVCRACMSIDRQLGPELQFALN